MKSSLRGEITMEAKVKARKKVVSDRGHRESCECDTHTDRQVHTEQSMLRLSVHGLLRLATKEARMRARIRESIMKMYRISIVRHNQAISSGPSLLCAAPSTANVFLPLLV